MANLIEQVTWEPGVYQFETTDPVEGGPNGVDNLPHKQLANRTAYLKAAADNLGARVNQVEQSVSPETQNIDTAGIETAIHLAALALQEGENMRRRVLAQGATVIKNKYVIQGFVLSKSDIRALHLSQSGVVGSGASKSAIDGIVVSIPDDDYHVSVPDNPSSTSLTVYAFLIKQPDSSYRVSIADTIPDTGELLYQLTIPANDTAANLGAVTLMDRRTLQPAAGWVSNFVPFTTITLPDGLPAQDYGIALEIEDASNVAAVGDLSVYDKAQNAFKVKLSGSADNVRIRWTLLNPSYR